MSAFFAPVPNIRFPLKAGDQLFTDAPDAEPNEHLQLRFNVALYEPEVIKAQSLLETVLQFTALVERIVAALTPRLQ
jgi:predicted glycosyltransferase